MIHSVRKACFTYSSLLALSATTLAQTEWRRFSEPGGFGLDVAPLGDRNADGVMDYAIVHGIPIVGAGFAQYQNVDLVSGADGSVFETILGVSQISWNNTRFGTMGDVNGDGVREVLYGKPSAAATTDGVVVYSGADQSVLYQLGSSSTQINFGDSVSSGGDLNGDGVDDFLVGIPRDSTGGARAGSMQAFSGADGSVLHTKFGGAENRFGSSVGPAGDVNGDGFADFSASSESFQGGPGRLFVYSGLDGSLLHSVQADSWLGGQVLILAAPGDVNGDGLDDFAVAAQRWELDGNEVGKVTVYSGSDGSILWRRTGQTYFNRFGYELAALGDTNGDGVCDLGVGAFGNFHQGSTNGAVLVLSGVDGEHLARIDEPGPNNQFLGYSIAPAGDVNGDGLADLIYGTPLDRPGGVLMGSAHLVTNLFGGPGRHFCDAQPNSSGEACTLKASKGSGADLDWHVDARGGPSGQFAYMLVGSGANWLSPTPIQFGSLCLDTTGGNFIGRYNIPGGGRFSVGAFDSVGVLQNLSGTSSTGMGFDIPPQLPLQGSPLIMPGMELHFQVWFRDQVGGQSGSNFSSGLSLTF